MGHITFRFDPAANLDGKCQGSAPVVTCDESGISSRAIAHELGHIFDVRAKTGGRSQLILDPIQGDKGNIIAGGSGDFVRSCAGYTGCDYPVLQHPPIRFPTDSNETKSYDEFGDMFPNWVNHSFSDDHAGNARAEWMDNHIALLIDLAKGK
jgi:hypothetical protein